MLASEVYLLIKRNHVRIDHQIHIRYLLASLSEQQVFRLLLLSEKVSNAYVIKVRRDIDQNTVLQGALNVRIYLRDEVVESCLIELFGGHALDTMEYLTNLRNDLTHGTDAVVRLDLELAERVVTVAIEQRIDVNVQRATEDECLTVVLRMFIQVPLLDSRKIGVIWLFRGLVESVKDELEMVPVLHEEHVRVIDNCNLDRR